MEPQHAGRAGRLRLRLRRLGLDAERTPVRPDNERGEHRPARRAALEVQSRRIDNHELRIANVEKQATDAATAMRAVEATLNALTTDVKVVREILQRLEAGQNGRAPPGR